MNILAMPHAAFAPHAAFGFRENAFAAHETITRMWLCIPKYPLDLMPLDYGVWDEVERRMSKQKIKGYDSVEELNKEATSRSHVYPCSSD